MRRGNRGKTLLMVSTTLVVSIIAFVTCGMCSLCYLAFGPLPTRSEQTSFAPKEQGRSTDYYDLILSGSFWRTGEALQVNRDPFGVEMVRNEALHLEMEITNKLPQTLDLVCYIEDAAGNRFGASLGDLFIPVFSPYETRQGDMIFFVPNEGQQIWLYCDLCDDEYGCVMGRNQVGGMQIR